MAELPTGATIYVAGHGGMVGSAIVRRVEAAGFEHIIVRGSGELDLRNGAAVDAFFAAERPEYVFLAAAKVGGILANDSYPADFLYDNLMIAANVIHASYQHGVAKLLNLGSSCIYPKHAPQPLSEGSLMTGPLEATNRAYAVAKIAAIELCDSYRRQHGCDFISAMPTNLYGPNDNYNPTTSHVMAALIRKFVEASEQGLPSVTVWGTGEPRREFLHVDDLADACLFLMRKVSEPGPINVGYGEDLSIMDLAGLIAEAVGFEGEILHDLEKPDGTPRKLLDSSRLTEQGWSPRIELREGIAATIADYRRARDKVA